MAFSVAKYVKVQRVASSNCIPAFCSQTYNYYAFFKTKDSASYHLVYTILKSIFIIASMQYGYLSSNQDTETQLLNLALHILIIYDNQHETITNAFLSKYPN